MRIIISPTKKMKIDNDSFKYEKLPIYIEKTKKIKKVLLSKNKEELKGIWNCSEKLLNQNQERLLNMNLESNLTCAILAYEGLQFQYMAPSLFTEKEFDYIKVHLRILSGFYGILEPFDGVVPYRLEMQSEFNIGIHKNLYQFWNNSISKIIENETNLVINLASKEYSKVITQTISSKIQFVNVVFGEVINSKLVEKGTLCKMARGEMVRFMAENNVKDLKGIIQFDRLGYKYSESYSNENNIVFIK